MNSTTFVTDRNFQALKMSLMSDPASGDTGPDSRRPADAHPAGQRSFRFLPKELTVKCRRLIESYHGIYGYVGLPDMLWLSDARDVIECHRELTQIFKKASKARSAKRANDTFLFIATVIVAVEVLARQNAKRRSCSATSRPSRAPGCWTCICIRRSAFTANSPTHSRILRRAPKGWRKSKPKCCGHRQQSASF